MADFRAGKPIVSTPSLNSTFSLPLNLCPHLGNFALLRFTPSSLSSRRRPSQPRQFVAHSASPFSSLAPRIDIVSTTERSDGTLLFEFGDPSEIVDRKGNSDSESKMSEEGDLESEEVASFRKILVEEETSGSGETEQGQTVDVALGPTKEDASGTETAATVKEDTFSVGEVDEVYEETNSTALSSKGDSTICQTVDQEIKETVTGFVDQGNKEIPMTTSIEREDQKILPEVATEESRKTLNINDENSTETLITLIEGEHKKPSTSVVDEESKEHLTLIIDETNKDTPSTFLEEKHEKSLQTSLVDEESEETVRGVTYLENEETLSTSDEDQHSRSPPLSLIDKESETTLTDADKKNKENLTSSIEDQHKRSPPTSLVVEESEKMLIAVDEENKEYLTTSAKENHNISSESILDLENKETLATSVEDQHKSSPPVSVTVLEGETMLTAVHEETKENLTTSVAEKDKTYSECVVGEDSKTNLGSIMDKEDKETLTTSVEEEHKNSTARVADEESKSNLVTSIVDEANNGKNPTTSAEEEHRKSLPSVAGRIVDEENRGTLLSSVVEGKKETITGVVKESKNVKVEYDDGEAQPRTVSLVADNIVNISEKDSHIQDSEEMKTIEVATSPMSLVHEVHGEECDDSTEVQEMDADSLDSVSLDAAAEVDESENEIKSDHASLEIKPLLDEGQCDQTSDDLSYMEEAQNSTMVDDSASEISSHDDRVNGDVAISCSTEKEDQQSLDTGLTGAVKRIKMDEKSCPTLALTPEGASLPLHTKALAGEVDAYFIAGENWFGVANGVAQWSLEGTKDGFYAQELLQNCETLVSNSSKVEVSEVGDAFRLSAASAKSPGLASVLIAYFDNKVLHVANVGDTGYMVIRNGSVLQRSSPMVSEFCLPVLIGTFDDPVDVIEEYQVEIEDGDVIIAATDGFFDNLYEQDVVSIVSKSLGANMAIKEVAEVLAEKAQLAGMSMSAQSPFADAAQAAGYAGYAGGKPDHVTVIVSLVQKR